MTVPEGQVVGFELEEDPVPSRPVIPPVTAPMGPPVRKPAAAPARPPRSELSLVAGGCREFGTVVAPALLVAAVAGVGVTFEGDVEGVAGGWAIEIAGTGAPPVVAGGAERIGVGTEIVGATGRPPVGCGATDTGAATEIDVGGGAVGSVLYVGMTGAMGAVAPEG